MQEVSSVWKTLEMQPAGVDFPVGIAWDGPWRVENFHDGFSSFETLNYSFDNDGYYAFNSEVSKNKLLIDTGVPKEGSVNPFSAGKTIIQYPLVIYPESSVLGDLTDSWQATFTVESLDNPSGEVCFIAGMDAGLSNSLQFCIAYHTINEPFFSSGQFKTRLWAGITDKGEIKMLRSLKPYLGWNFMRSTEWNWKVNFSSGRVPCFKISINNEVIFYYDGISYNPERIGFGVGHGHFWNSSVANNYQLRSAYYSLSKIKVERVIYV
ncbi:MAG: hypothetical protein JXA60_03265 [Candidatus Coatesbacteria bacterium]|nr:hypothetical protein [Candidatus Coatesbacteria bacterium]